MTNVEQNAAVPAAARLPCHIFSAVRHRVWSSPLSGHEDRIDPQREVIGRKDSMDRQSLPRFPARLECILFLELVESWEHR
jgi:hypothetical protein